MNKEQIQHYVMRYLEATACHIIEKSPAHVKVKLSPEADKALTNRSYYWSFVERTGAEPETMSFTFIFDPEQMEHLNNSQSTINSKPPANVPAANPDSILGRYFGFVPASANPRSLNEQLTYGNARLQQIFNTVKTNGRFVHLYEEPEEHETHPISAASFSSWFIVNFRVEFICDMKRDELHSLGISLSTGEIIENFHAYLVSKPLTPRLPAHTHIRESISLLRAKQELEKYLENIIKSYDQSWASEAMERMKTEMSYIDSYYQNLIKEAEEEKKQEIKDQYENRIKEIEWQYKPRIEVSVTNCGIFHLLADRFRGFDASPYNLTKKH